MASQDTPWEKLLQPVWWLVKDEQKLKELERMRDWPKESDRFREANFIYPEYYRGQNFYGIEGGYLSVEAALSYDSIISSTLPPKEAWVREELLRAIQVKPRRILDLGCGTGSTTLLLKKAFPEAEVIGIDLSPYMLAMADYKAQQEGLDIHWWQRRAENTLLAGQWVDLITISLVLHETPPAISQAMVQEAFRLLVAGGQLVILTPHQQMLRETLWLADIFAPPHLKAFSQENLEAGLELAGFRRIKTDIFWMVHQITQGFKPLTGREPITVEEELDLLSQPVVNPAF